MTIDISNGMLNFKFQNLTPIDETGLYIKFLNSVMEENKRYTINWYTKCCHLKLQSLIQFFFFLHNHQIYQYCSKSFQDEIEKKCL